MDEQKSDNTPQNDSSINEEDFTQPSDQEQEKKTSKDASDSENKKPSDIEKDQLSEEQKEVLKLKKRLKKYKKRLKKYKQKLEKQEEKYAYLNAELENTRKHFLKQRGIEGNRTVNQVLTKFTPLIDSFESALELKKAAKKNAESDQVEEFIRGFEQVYSQLKDIFEQYGLKTIDKTGIPFDYNEHEVMMRVIDDAEPEDTVIQILQRGYKRNDEVIRPAKVIITQKTPPKKEEKPKKDTKKEKNGKKQDRAENEAEESKSTKDEPKSTDLDEKATSK